MLAFMGKIVFSPIFPFRRGIAKKIINRPMSSLPGARQLNQHSDKFASKLKSKSLSDAASSRNDETSSSFFLPESELPSKLHGLLEKFVGFLPVTDKSSQQRSPYEFKYSSSDSRGGHIVDQEFAYMPRRDEEKLVCKLMEDRQAVRKKRKNTRSDKINNPLIAIPGSPGSGKSTFLVNFPDSVAYKEYIEERHGNQAAAIGPIVSTLSFNGDMGRGGTLAPGLRVLYGAAKSMSLLPEEDTWYRFYNIFEHYEGITMFEAAEVVRHAFGPDRSLLFIVDEVAKASVSFDKKDDVKVMGQLGAVLDAYGDVDVLVSSLSPQYVYSLVTNTQRRSVDYAVLSPLMELGKAECRVWADRIIKEVEREYEDEEKTKKYTVSEDIKSLLRNCYLLYSGHPRALEYMKERFRKSSVSNKVVAYLKSRVSFSTLLFDTLPAILRVDHFTPIIDEMRADQLEKFVFSAGRYFDAESGDSAEFRELLETGSIFVRSGPTAVVDDSDELLEDDSGDVPTSFASAVSSVSMLTWIADHPKSLVSEFPRTRAAVRLLGDLCDSEGKMKISTFWERIVVFTVMSRSFERMSLYEVFGISLTHQLLTTTKFELSCKIAAVASGYTGLPSAPEKEEEEKNILTVYDDNQAGFDAHALVDNKHFYLQAKILFPDVETPKTGKTAVAGEPVAGAMSAEEPRPVVVTSEKELVNIPLEEPVMKTKTSDEIVAAALPFVLLTHLWKYQYQTQEDVQKEDLSQKTKVELGVILGDLTGKPLCPKFFRKTKKDQLIAMITTSQLTPQQVAAALANVHFVVYNWGDDGEVSKQTPPLKEQGEGEEPLLQASSSQPLSKPLSKSLSKPLSKEGVKALRPHC